MEVTVWLLILSFITLDDDKLKYSRLATYSTQSTCLEMVDPYKELLEAMDVTKIKAAKLGCYSKVIKQPI